MCKPRARLITTATYYYVVVLESHDLLSQLLTPYINLPFLVVWDFQVVVLAFFILTTISSPRDPGQFHFFLSTRYHLRTTLPAHMLQP